MRRTEILKRKVPIFNSELSLSTQSCVFSDEKRDFVRKSLSIMALKCL
jgi:hypothetical protein